MQLKKSDKRRKILLIKILFIHIFNKKYTFVIIIVYTIKKSLCIHARNRVDKKY